MDNAPRRLEQLQMTITKAELLGDERRRLIIELHEGGMTQVELAARLSRASRRAGGGDVGLDAVQKIISRYRDTSKEGSPNGRRRARVRSQDPGREADGAPAEPAAR